MRLILQFFYVVRFSAPFPLAQRRVLLELDTDFFWDISIDWGVSWDFTREVGVSWDLTAKMGVSWVLTMEVVVLSWDLTT